MLGATQLSNVYGQEPTLPPEFLMRYAIRTRTYPVLWIDYHTVAWETVVDRTPFYVRVRHGWAGAYRTRVVFTLAG